MSLLRMIVRPLKAAKPATTSSMLALSHCTVIRGACDCSASARCAARYSSIDIDRPSVGVVTRAACSGPPVTGGGDPLSAARRGGGENGGRGDGAAGPGCEAGTLRADAHAHLSGGALDLVILQRVEIDHHAHDVRFELRVAHVANAAAVLAVVQRGRRGEADAVQIDDEPCGIREGEVLNLRRPLQVDDDLDLAGGRQHADSADLAVPAATRHRRPRKGPGNDDGQQRREGKNALHGVSPCLASDNVSCRSNPNSCTVNTTSRGRICVTFKRPTMSPAFTR